MGEPNGGAKGGNGRNGNGLMCPACGRWARQEREQICQSCQVKYEDSAADALVNGQILLEAAWVREHGPRVLEQAEKVRDQKKAAFNALSSDVRQKVAARIEGTRGVTQLPKGAVEKARKIVREQIWKDSNGDKFFAEMKNAERAVAELELAISAYQKAQPKSAA